MKKKSNLEFKAKLLFDNYNLQPVCEYRFNQDRRWRFDFAFPDKKIAVEIEGGTFLKKSRHTTSTGFEGDCYKYNSATTLGWRLFRFTRNMLTIENFRDVYLSVID